MSNMVVMDERSSDMGLESFPYGVGPTADLPPGYVSETVPEVREFDQQPRSSERPGHDGIAVITPHDEVGDDTDAEAEDAAEAAAALREIAAKPDLPVAEIGAVTTAQTVDKAAIESAKPVEPVQPITLREEPVDPVSHLDTPYEPQPAPESVPEAAEQTHATETEAPEPTTDQNGNGGEPPIEPPESNGGDFAEQPEEPDNEGDPREVRRAWAPGQAREALAKAVELAEKNGIPLNKLFNESSVGAQMLPRLMDKRLTNEEIAQLDSEDPTNGGQRAKTDAVRVTQIASRLFEIAKKQLPAEVQEQLPQPTGKVLSRQVPPEEMKAPYGPRLEELRKTSGVNTQDLANALDVSKAALRRLERGEVRPQGIGVVLGMAKLCGASEAETRDLARQYLESRGTPPERARIKAEEMDLGILQMIKLPERTEAAPSPEPAPESGLPVVRSWLPEQRKDLVMAVEKSLGSQGNIKDLLSAYPEGGRVHQVAELLADPNVPYEDIRERLGITDHLLQNYVLEVTNTLTGQLDQNNLPDYFPVPEGINISASRPAACTQLIDIRKDRGMSIDGLAARTQMSPDKVERILNGTAWPAPQAGIDRIIRALNVDRETAIHIRNSYIEDRQLVMRARQARRQGR